jgi:glycerophosphoryl diester phosphodiesterase
MSALMKRVAWTSACAAAGAAGLLHGATMKQVVAHRGASGYAPEHTRAAYLLAISQHADFVEQDLGITKDGQLVVLHDASLERTTNVEDVFPNRFIEIPGRDGPTKHWMLYDFTLAEVKQLDAGSWFAPQFAGQDILTWQEAIDLVKGKAGLYPELKSPEIYRARGVEMEPLVVESIRHNGFDKPVAGTPLIFQSFDEMSLRALARDLPDVPRVFLMEGPIAQVWLTSPKLAEASTFVTGIAPSKAIVESHPEVVAQAHTNHLSVTPYTFRAADHGKYASVGDEMHHFLFDLGVDALFTDNPDQFPRK